MNIQQIGTIKTPYKKLSDCPNNISNDGPMCEIVVDSAYEKALLGVDNLNKILILYWLGSDNHKIILQGHGHGDQTQLRGIFTLRGTQRPNPIGVAVLKIEKVEGNSVFVKGLDCLDGTILLDIKPAIYQELCESK
ncbi:MAG: tRNA (N6-threonylcarbamoyladenosine(37)-N6)-methyltransferase TrmO [Bacteroidales bacterium]